MSEFYKILKSRKLDFHTGQPIWKYDISDFEFEQLKERFKIVSRFSELDPRTCAVYFAEWWKRNYNGGYPSKEEIFNSIGYSKLCFDSIEFFELAKKGGYLLNYKWIKIQNTLYLKTLLLQGGLPLKHIQNNQGKYRDFLLSIIHLNPTSITDFSTNIELINLLPKSSQNDIIYSSCLEIVRAVLNNDESELLSFKENNQLKQITEDLIIERDKVRKKNNTIKFKWNFNSKSNSFYLNAIITSKIGFEELNYILNNNLVNYSNEYKLFIGADLVAKFIKRNNDTFKVVQFKDFVNFKDGFEPEIYVMDELDKIYDANHLLHTKLNIDFPTLWVISNDENFVLEKSRHTNNNFGYVLLDNTFSIDGRIEEKTDLELNNKSYVLIKFKDVIQLKDSIGNIIKFKTNTENIFDWTILSENPKWLVKGNLNIVKNSLRILVYDKNGQRINKPNIEWKSVNKNYWNSIHNPLELGALDVKISYDGIDEFERVFNIGNLNISANSDYKNPQLTTNNNSFILEVYKSDFYDFNIDQNKINFVITNPSKFPASVKTRIKVNNQNLGLIAEVLSPFQGIILIDQDENILDVDEIYLDKIKGWRLIANSYGKEFEVRLSNNKNHEIIISKKIERKVKPLFEFYDTYKALFQLFNIIDSDNFLKMEICEVLPNKKNKTIKSYSIKQFSETIKWEVNYENIIKFNEIGNIDISNSVYALPLDCDLKYIDKIEIKKESDYYSINTANVDKFILFSDKNSKFKIKPEFICVNPENELTTIDDRNNRIINYSQQLLVNDFGDDVWNRFWIYYYLCRENDLPFATFDIIKTITTSSELAAKAFTFLSIKFDDREFKFSGNDFVELENDLGFSFHWVKLSDWENICQIYPDIFEAIAFMLSLKWNKLKVCLLQKGTNNNFVFYAELNNVRERLGERVLNQLPFYDIGKDRNNYIKPIPQKQWNDQVNILVIAPLTVASSIKGANTGLWHVNGDNFRRRIKYVENLDKKWYEESLIYYLN
ncbi:hypothetical protein [Lutibacter sp.]|uniref:hypothetical protein n=1 Tax=Lutibacter sp. TaxID=1925666 RepID=UPI00273578D2|nr:hypothetical protein [Lutibacter sp.]MDP3312327.1 hypothetical protein [Lutibacter sp.]